MARIILVRDDTKDIGTCAKCEQDFVDERGDGRMIYKTQWHGDVCTFCYEDIRDAAMDALEGTL